MVTGTDPFTGLLEAQEGAGTISTTDSTFTPAADLPDADYSWAVKAHDANGLSSAWTAAETFVVQAPPVGAEPMVYLPALFKE